MDKLRKTFSGNTLLLLGLMVAVIVFGTANRVLFKLMLIPMVNYPFFTNQLTSFIYIPFFWPIVWVFFKTGRIDEEQRSFPWWKFAIMGTLDASAGLLMTFGGAHTSGPMQLLLSQAAIPMTMLFSWIVSLEALAFIFKRVLQVNYKWNHYVGAGTILLGIVVSLYGQLFGGGDSGSSSSVAGLIIFFSSSIPTAFSGVYKEIGFKGADLDVYYVNAWVATYQFVVGMLFLPITTLHSFGGLAFDEIPANLWDGAKCFAGYGEGCEGAYYYVCGYLAINIIYNIVLLMMIKYGSAALFYVASAVILPAADICFTQKWIMGVNAQPLTWYDVVGLIIILTGLVVYRFLGKESPKEGEGKDGEHHDKHESDDDDEIEEVPILSFQVGEVRHIRRRKPSRREHVPRSVSTVRNTYMSRLGFKEMPSSVGASLQREDYYA